MGPESSPQHNQPSSLTSLRYHWNQFVNIQAFPVQSPKSSRSLWDVHGDGITEMAQTEMVYTSGQTNFHQSFMSLCRNNSFYGWDSLFSYLGMKVCIGASFLFSFLSRSKDLCFVSRGARQTLSPNVTVSNSNYLKCRRIYFLEELQRKSKVKLSRVQAEIC